MVDGVGAAFAAGRINRMLAKMMSSTRIFFMKELWGFGFGFNGFGYHWIPLDGKK